MRCRSRTHTPAGLAAAAVCAAVALTGCSSGGSSGSQGKQAPSTGPTTTAVSPSATGAAATTPGADASPTVSGAASMGVQGVWLAAQDGAKVQLVLGEGKAGLTSTSLCGGTYTGTSPIRISLTCMDGNKDRTSGRGSLSTDGMTLKVVWGHGPTDVFVRTGLPSS